MSTNATAKSLVIVVGAGASKEANLPTGAELKKKIAEVLNLSYEFGFQRNSGDAIIDEALRIAAQSANPPRQDIDPYLKAARRICDAMPQAISIDNFIDSHRSDESIALCGKLAIARCILSAERQSNLYVDPGNIYNKIDFSAVESTWFNSFFQLLTENCQGSELSDRLSAVAIICFNYDRCIEHYLHSALQNYYGISSDEATSVMSRLEIYHPYGTVGKLPWQHRDGGFTFGGSPNAKKLLALTGQLRTFTEGVDTLRSDVVSIRSLLSTAKRIGFLGFAFHRLNLQLLFPGPVVGQTRTRRCPVFATAYGISSSDLELIKHELCDLASIHVSRVFLHNDLKCFSLFHEYGRSLSLQ